MFAEPEYFSYLSKEDQEQYKELQKKLNKYSKRSGRNKKTEELECVFEEIKEYCIRNDKNDNMRSMVCGICFLTIGIAINVKQIQFIVQKCKSSINTTMRNMGYVLLQLRGDACEELLMYMPEIGKNTTELRNWSIRIKVDDEKIIDNKKRVSKNSKVLQKHKQAKIAAAAKKQVKVQPKLQKSETITDNLLPDPDSILLTVEDEIVFFGLQQSGCWDKVDSYFNPFFALN